MYSVALPILIGVVLASGAVGAQTVQNPVGASYCSVAVNYNSALSVVIDPIANTQGVYVRSGWFWSGNSTTGAVYISIGASAQPVPFSSASVPPGGTEQLAFPFYVKPKQGVWMAAGQPNLGFAMSYDFTGHAPYIGNTNQTTPCK